MTKNETRALIVMCMNTLENRASEAVIKHELGLTNEDLNRFYGFLCEQERRLHGTHPDFKQGDQ
jgi:hypothetical protein